LEFLWSEDKVIGLKRLGREEDGNVSGSAVDASGSSTTEFVWGSDLIVGVGARWERQIDSDLESTDFDFLAIVLKSKPRGEMTTHTKTRGGGGGGNWKGCGQGQGGGN
jgi:hypothetical protein